MSGSWTSSATLPVTDWYAAHGFTYNGDAYFAGGYSALSGYITKTYKVTIATMALTAMANTTQAALDGLHGWIGSNWHQVANNSTSVGVYNPATNVWTTTGGAPPAGEAGAGGTTGNGTLAFTVGKSQGSGLVYLGDHYQWNGSAWTAKAVYPLGIYETRGVQSAVGATDRLDYCGGYTYNTATSANVTQTAHYSYSIASNAWTSRAASPVAVSTHMMTTMSGPFSGWMMLAGEGSGGTSLKSVYGYTLSTNAFTAYAAFDVGIYWSGYTQAGAANSTILGGAGSTTYLNQARAYTINSAPNTPTLNSPANNVAADAAQAQAFSWTFSDPDGGDTQSAWAIRFINQSTSTSYWWNAGTGALQTTEVFNSGSVQSVTIPANVFTNNVTYTWSVNYKDTFGGASASYPAARSISFSATPITTITAPFATVTSLTTQRVYWNYSQASGLAQAYYQAKVFTAATVTGGGFDPNTSAAVWDSGQVASTARSAVLGGLADGQSYYVFMRTATAAPNWSAWTSSAFTTSANASLGVAVRLTQTVEYVYQQLATQTGRPVPDVDADSAVQNSIQPINRLALGTTNMTPVGTESGGVVPGEITSPALDSAVAVISHTTGTNSFTLQQNWTADTLTTIYLVGVLNNLPYRMAPGQPDYIPGSTNQRRLVFLFRLPHALNVQAGDSFETDVTVTF